MVLGYFIVELSLGMVYTVYELFLERLTLAIQLNIWIFFLKLEQYETKLQVDL